MYQIKSTVGRSEINRKFKKGGFWSKESQVEVSGLEDVMQRLLDLHRGFGGRLAGSVTDACVLLCAVFAARINL